MDDLSKVRLGPAYPNADSTFTMKDVMVEHNSTVDKYLVTMKPHDCGVDFAALALDALQVLYKTVFILVI